jgi:hypothetical protein
MAHPKPESQIGSAANAVGPSDFCNRLDIVFGQFRGMIGPNTTMLFL